MTGSNDNDTAQWEAKVLDTFIVDGRLTHLPAQRKKRMVILRFLVDKFDPTRSYTENEVNAVLSRYHHDVATLRREFVWWGLMDRERSVYRRTPAEHAPRPNSIDT